MRPESQAAAPSAISTKFSKRAASQTFRAVRSCFVERRPIFTPIVGAHAYAQKGKKVNSFHRQTINRFEWFKAVLSADISPNAKCVAAALSICFANNDTGKINPKIATISEAINASKDSAKRGIRTLLDEGWLARTEGRGRGNSTSYRLLSPDGNIRLTSESADANDRSKKGGSCAPSGSRKGATPHRKGRNSAPFHNKAKQSSEQDVRDRRVWNWPVVPKEIFPDEVELISEWNDYLSANGFPALEDIFALRISVGGEFAYAVPFRLVPEPVRKELLEETWRFFSWAVDQLAN